MKGNLQLCLLLQLLSLLGLGLASEYHGYQVFRLTPQRNSHLRWLKALQDRDTGLDIDFWVEPTSLQRNVDLMVGPKHIEIITEMMDEVKLPFTLIFEDLQKSIENHQKSNSRTNRSTNPGSGLNYDFDRYMRYGEIMIWIDNKLATSNHCGTVLNCETIYIGRTHENRDMKVVKLSNGGVGKRKVWIDAGIHAREWVSPTTALYFIERLIDDYLSDPVIREMFDTYDFYILPLINADGYEYTHTNDRMWRKSRTIYSGNLCYGTDINRNFDHMWNYIGASSNSCSQTYCGPNAQSEVEAQNVANFVMSHNGRWDVFLTMHSYSQLWMAPWGYSKDPPATYTELMRVATKAVDALTAVHGTEYFAGSASEILYESSGTSRDWAYGVPQIPYVYTIELRDQGEYGFLLPPEQILPTAEETWAGLKAMVKAIIDGT